MASGALVVSDQAPTVCRHPKLVQPYVTGRGMLKLTIGLLVGAVAVLPLVLAVTDRGVSPRYEAPMDGGDPWIGRPGRSLAKGSSGVPVAEPVRSRVPPQIEAPARSVQSSLADVLSAGVAAGATWPERLRAADVLRRCRGFGHQQRAITTMSFGGALEPGAYRMLEAGIRERAGQCDDLLRLPADAVVAAEAALLKELTSDDSPLTAPSLRKADGSPLSRERMDAAKAEMRSLFSAGIASITPLARKANPMQLSRGVDYFGSPCKGLGVSLVMAPKRLNYSSINVHVFAPSNRRTRTDAMSAGSKFPRFTPCFAPGVGCKGSQCVTHPQVLQ